VVTLVKGAAQGPALRRAARDGQRLVPVLDGQGRPDHALALDVVGGVAKGTAAKRVRPAPLEASMGLEEALQRLQDSGWDELPVVDPAGAYVGIFGYRDMVPGKGGSPA
jgi:CBS domain-containing protein